MIREEKHTVRFQNCYFWGDSQVMGYGRLNKMVQVKDTLKKNQGLPCWSWWHSPLFFIHQFMRLFLLLLLYHSGKSPSFIIICSFLSILCSLSSSILCSANESWLSMEIFAFSSVGLEMEMSAYNSWRYLICHLLGTDFLRYIFDLFSSVSFEKLSSWCCNNASMIASLLVAGEQL